MWARSNPGTTEDLLGVWGTAANNVLAISSLKVRKFNGTAWVVGPMVPEIEEGMGRRGGPPAVRALGSSIATTTFLAAVTVPAEGSSDGGRGVMIKVMGMAGTVRAHAQPVRGQHLGPRGQRHLGRRRRLRHSLERHRVGEPLDGPHAQQRPAGRVGLVGNRRVGRGRGRVPPRGRHVDARRCPGAGAANFLGIWGSAANDIWVVGNSAAQHWNGTTWSRAFVAANEIIRGVWGSGANDVWAVGDGGRIVHWNGEVWFQVASGSTETLNGVWGSGARTTSGPSARTAPALHYTAARATAAGRATRPSGRARSRARGEACASRARRSRSARASRPRHRGLLGQQPRGSATAPFRPATSPWRCRASAMWSTSRWASTTPAR